MESAASLLCLLFSILCFTAGASAKPHYVVLFPSVIYHPYTGKVHVHLMDLDAPVRVTLHLESSHGVPDLILEEQGSDVLQLNWPRFYNVSTYPERYKELAFFVVTIEGGSLQVSKKQGVVVEGRELGTLVQTDKDVYKPGETVKIRIVRFDQNLLPSNKEIPLVSVQDPKGSHVSQWQEVSLRQGIVDLSLPLAAYTTLGEYTIEVGRKRHSFSVKDYDLHPFKVLIQLPRVVMAKDENIPLDICGWSSSGNTFRGRAEARLCQYITGQRLQSMWICADFNGQTGRDGCFSTKVPMASFNRTYLRSTSHLYAYASLLEEETGILQKASNSCRIVHEVAIITFESIERFYRPGIPSTGTMLLKGTNGSVLKEEEFLLVVKNRGEVQSKTLLTDGSGRASFELDTSGWSSKVTLHGELKDDSPASRDEGERLPSYQSVVRSLFPVTSDSKSFLKMRRVEKRLPCGRPHQLQVDYFLDEEATGPRLHSLDVVLLVLAKGTMVSILRKELRAEAGLRGSFSLDLPIGPELAPTATVLGYMVLPDGEMVADSTKLNVAKCFPSKVNLSFSQQRVMVGSHIHLKVQAEPGSLCAIYALEERMWLSGSKVKVNPNTVYDSLQWLTGSKAPLSDVEYDLKYCLSKDYEGWIALLPSITCFDMKPSGWMACNHSLWRREAPLPGSATLVKLQDANLKRSKRISYPRGPILTSPSIICNNIKDKAKRDSCMNELMFRKSLLPDNQPGSATLVKDAGLKIVTNSELGCISNSQYQSFEDILYPTGANPQDIEQTGVMQDTLLQNDSLGTWLWELVAVGEGGSTEVTVTVPDAVTKWHTGMVCMSPLGLGLAPATTLTVFKPFTMELDLPYAVVHHETFTLRATVTTSLQQCLQVHVTLVESAELEVLASADEEYSGCVCEDKARTFQWDVRATNVGEVIVTITAKTLLSEGLCDTEMPIIPAQGQVDTKSRLLKVQPPRPM